MTRTKYYPWHPISCFNNWRKLFTTRCNKSGFLLISSKSVVSLFRNVFPGHVIALFGDIPWPPWSPDLWASDFFSLGHLKERAFRTRPQSIQELRHRISQEIEEVNGNADLLQRGMNNFHQNLQQTVRHRGEKLIGVIFKKVIVIYKIALFKCYFVPFHSRNCYTNFWVAIPNPSDPNSGLCIIMLFIRNVLKVSNICALAVTASYLCIIQILFKTVYHSDGVTCMCVFGPSIIKCYQHLISRTVKKAVAPM
jgi:hypothetical protein